MDPQVSIIIPTHGRDELLRRAVESVLNQTWQDFEVLVVDDASPSAVVLPNEPRLRVLRRGHRGGTAAARNTGIAEARGNCLTFLDDDDYYSSERLVKGLEATTRADVSVCWARSSVPSSVEWRGEIEGRVDDRILDQRVPPIGTCTVPRMLVPQFTERFTSSEDVEWWLRLAQSASFTTVPHELYVVGVHEGARKTEQTADRLRCRLLLLEEHAEYFAGHPRAAAQQWKRAGGLALVMGDMKTARSSFWQSMKTKPNPRTALHLVRSMVGFRRRQG